MSHSTNSSIDSENSSESDNSKQNCKIILAIIGSRAMVSQKLFDLKMELWIKEYGEPDEIVSGGAKGADTMAEAYAHKKNIPITIFKPEYDKYKGRVAPLVRNTKIIQYCTHVLAFPSRNGSGTQDALQKAKRFKKCVSIYWID